MRDRARKAHAVALPHKGRKEAEMKRYYSTRGPLKKGKDSKIEQKMKNSKKVINTACATGSICAQIE